MDKGGESNQRIPYLLLTPRRFRNPTAQYGSLVEEALSDRARVLYSSPFRRLQDKTQVFALESNASVRSRLTHSLEVSMVGRLLAQKIVLDRRVRELFTSEDEADAFTVYAETACLMHDLGNPPFGHFCEKTIQAWFLARKEKFIQDLQIASSADAMAVFERGFQDFACFDGNPQGFRIATKLQFNHDEHGLNLSSTQLAASLKYPWSPEDLERPKQKKIGVFSTEHTHLKKVREASELLPKQRHLLAYVMEAADDISYCLSDVEDGMEKQVIEWPLFISYVKSRLRSDVQQRDAAQRELISRLQALPDSFYDQEAVAASTGPKTWQAAILVLRTSVSRFLVEHCAKRCGDELDSVLHGDVEKFESLIDDRDSEPGWIVGLMKSFAHEHLYTSRVVRSRELTTYKVITGLLDSFECVLSNCHGDRFDALLRRQSTAGGDDHPISVESALVALLPKKYVRVYSEDRKLIGRELSEEEQRVREFIIRAHLIVDYVSGMTDEFALSTYQLVSGMRTHV